MRGLDYTTVKNNIINFSELVKEKSYIQRNIFLWPRLRTVSMR